MYPLTHNGNCYDEGWQKFCAGQRRSQQREDFTLRRSELTLGGAFLQGTIGAYTTYRASFKLIYLSINIKW